MESNHSAMPAGPATPENDNAPCQARVIGEQEKANSHDSADGEGSSKALATMRARAGLAGCTLHELADGGYLICRWNLSTFAPCLRCVGDLLRKIGGRHG